MSYLDKLHRFKNRPTPSQESLKSEEALPRLHHIDAPSRQVQPGDRITWSRGDKTRQIGLVDFVHTDEQGNSWVFVSTGKTWSALNMKCVEWSPL